MWVDPVEVYCSRPAEALEVECSQAAVAVAAERSWEFRYLENLTAFRCRRSILTDASSFHRPNRLSVVLSV